jgi:PAS domain S-box-containing protein
MKTSQTSTKGASEAAQLEALLDAMPAIVLIAHDAECRLITGNRAANAFLRLTPERNASVTAPTGEAPTHFRVLKDGCELAPNELPVQLAARGIVLRDFEEEVVFDDGTRYTLLGNATPILDADGRPCGAIAAFIDITAYRASRTEIERERRLFQSLTEHLPHVVARVSTEGRYLYVSPALSRVTGKPQDYFIGKTPEEAGGPPYLCQKLKETREHVLRTKTQHAMEFSYETLAGPADFVYIAVPELDREANVISLLTVSFDVTEQRRVARAMKQSADLLRRAQQIAKMGSYECDLVGGKINLSEQLCAIFGVDPSAPPRDPEAMYDYIPLDEVGDVRLAFETMLITNAPYRLEHTVRRSDGTTRRVLSQGEVVARDLNGKATRVVGTVLDITEQRRAEEELSKAQRLESLGIMAGGIAHDFNNLLTAIFGNIELATVYAKERPAENASVLEALDEAQSAFKRAKDLAQQLLTFSRGGAPLRQSVALGKLVEDATRFALRGSSMSVQFHIDSDLWYVCVDESQIGQVVNNLVINAVQAIPDNGLLRIEAHNVVMQEDNPFGLYAGPYVQVQFRDNGAGIPDDHLAKIFDPYFTTKAAGTGLGLATTYSIIKRHDGHITVASAPGQGTSFLLYLPATDESPASTVASPQLSLQRRGRALVMDDEEAVRRVGKALLQRLGYEVELACDGEDALRLFQDAEQRGEPFAVVILDLTVPGGMGGKECFERLRAVNPCVPALVSSGYFNDPVIAQYAAHGFRGVIPKPYQLADLGRALAALDLPIPD